MDTPEPLPNDPEVYLFWMNFLRLTIAAEEIIGGLAGVHEVLSKHVLSSGELFTGTALAFFLFAFVAGIVLAVNKNWGTFPSLVVQAAQLFQFSAAGLFYHFVCGAEVVVGYYTGDEGANLASGLGLRAWLSLAAPASSALNPDAVLQSLPEDTITGINLAALGAFMCLVLARRANRSRRDASILQRSITL